MARACCRRRPRPPVLTRSLRLLTHTCRRPGPRRLGAWRPVRRRRAVPPGRPGAPRRGTAPAWGVRPASPRRPRSDRSPGRPAVPRWRRTRRPAGRCYGCPGDAEPIRRPRWRHIAPTGATEPRSAATPAPPAPKVAAHCTPGRHRPAIRRHPAFRPGGNATCQRAVRDEAVAHPGSGRAFRRRVRGGRARSPPPPRARAAARTTRRRSTWRRSAPRCGRGSR